MSSNPLPFDLITDQATIYDIPPMLKTNTRAVIITDQHFGRRYGLKEFPTFCQNLNKLLQAKNANCLFLLGDTIDWHTRDDYKFAFSEVFKYLESLQIPVFVLGGNHDKERLLGLNFDDSQSNIKIVADSFIRINHPNYQPIQKNEEQSDKSALNNVSGVLLGHDLGNNFQVDPWDAPVYVKWMREVFEKYFAPDEIMLLGHTHQNIAWPKEKCYSIAQFSTEFKRYFYAFIEDTGKGYNVEIASC